MKYIVFALILVTSAFAPQHSLSQAATLPKPTVSIDSNYPAVGSGAANAFRRHVDELTQYLQTDCGLTVTIRADKADYLVKMTYTERGYGKASKIEIANPEGMTISTWDSGSCHQSSESVVF